MPTRLAPVIFEFGARTTAPSRVHRWIGYVPGRAAGGIPIRGGGSQSRISDTPVFRRVCAHMRSRTCSIPGRGCRRSRSRWRFPEAVTADFTVTRALLRPGRAYEEAVARFTPYDQSSRRKSGSARRDARADPADARGAARGIHLRQQSPGRKCSGDDSGHRRLAPRQNIGFEFFKCCGVSISYEPANSCQRQIEMS